MADVRPIVGISMGDPFGNGPEISVKSLADKTLYDRCKPLIVGDKSSMEYALAVARKVSGIDLKLNIVKEPAEGKFGIDLKYRWFSNIMVVCELVYLKEELL